MPTRPRLVRRAPLFKRIQAYLSPLDLLLWLSEELNSNDLEDTLKQWVVPAGLFMNVAFMVARANAKGVDPGEDVFADAYERRGSGWLAWFVCLVLWAHAVSFSIANHFIVGDLRSPLTHHSLLYQRRLHLLANTTLPPLRERCQQSPQYPLCSPRTRRLLAHVIIAPPLLL